MPTKKGLFYAKGHVWISVSGDEAFLGITDYAQNSLGVIVFAESEPEGTLLSPGDICGAAESAKICFNVISPVSGEITGTNEGIAKDPGRLNRDPYGEFICRLSLSGKDELAGLMNAAEYEEFCRELKRRGM